MYKYGTSTKKVMSLGAFVCFSVCLFISLFSQLHQKVVNKYSYIFFCEHSGCKISQIFKGPIFNVFSMTLSFWLTLLQKESVNLHEIFYMGRFCPKEDMTTFWERTGSYSG